MTGLLAFSVGIYAFQIGRYDATARMAPDDAARVWAALPEQWLWLLALACLDLSCLALSAWRWPAYENLYNGGSILCQMSEY